MGKFTKEETALIKNIVATLTVKRIPDPEIIHDVYDQTKKILSRRAPYNIRQRIKNESYHWYKTMTRHYFVTLFTYG